MDKVNVTMPLSASIVLNDVINILLYAKKTTSDGKEYIVDRELPFKLRYRLNKNRLLFQKDAEFFNQQRLFALAKYGTPTADGQNVTLATDEAKEKFKDELGKILQTPVTHDVVKLSPEDIDLVEDPDIAVSPDAMGLFIGYMTDDPELQQDLNTPITLRIKEDIAPAPKAKETPKTEEAPAVEPVEEIPVVEPEKVAPAESVVEEKPAPKKRTTTKKTTTKKSEDTPATEETPKKTTAKKTSTTKKTTTTKKSTTTKKTTTKKEAEA